MSTKGIYGLSGSGIDVDSMVKVGMLTKQNQYDKLYKKEVKNEWTKEAYSNVYSDLNTFTSSTLYNYKLSSSTNPQTVSSTSSSVVTATANADAAEMSHTVSVSSLASNAYLLTGSSGITRNSSSTSSSSIYLTDLIDTSSWTSDSKIDLTVGDGSSTKTLTLTYDQVVTGKETLNDLASAFKGLGLNLTSSYDSSNDAFTIYNKSSGKDNTISITANNTDSATLMSNLGLGQVSTTYATDGTATSSMGSTLTFTSGTAQSVTGTNASVTIDGKTYDSLSSNKLTVSNVTYSFLTTGSSTLTVSQDTDKIISNVKQFVTDYNKMLDELNTKYNETQYSDYGVLTKSQESAMTTEQISSWNEKAKSGLLYHDQTIGNIISSMREAIYTPVSSVDSNYNSMMAIGVTSSTDRGHLTLDEDKLKKALAADPDCVYQLFDSSGSVTASDGTTSTDYDAEGVAQRLSDKLYAGLSTMKDYAGTSTDASDDSTLGNLILDLKTKMSDFKTMMDAYEDKLYEKYDAMETAIQQISASSSYITSSS